MNCEVLRGHVNTAQHKVNGKLTNSASSLVNPRDKQNVPYVTEFLLHLKDAVCRPNGISRINARVHYSSITLFMMQFVIDGLLTLYSYVELSILEQLLLISKAAHVLLILKRQSALFLDNKLYHDLQRTFQDAFLTAAKFKVHRPDKPLYLCLNSNDNIERFFCNLRGKFKNCNFTALDVTNAVRSMILLHDNQLENLEWFKSSCKRLCLDNSNASDWTGSLTVGDIDLVKIWNLGRAQAAQALLEQDIGNFSGNFSSLPKSVTMQKPYGTRRVGVRPWRPGAVYVGDGSDSEDEDDISNNDDPSVFEKQSINESMVDMIPSFGDPHDVKVLVGDKYVYKTTVLNGLFRKQPISSERLQRVHGVSDLDNKEYSEPDLEDCLYLGDVVLAHVKKDLIICKILRISFEGNENKKLLKAEDLAKATTLLNLIQLKCETLDDYRDYIIIKGETLGEAMNIEGKECYCIKPEFDTLETSGPLVMFVDKQLVLDYNVQLNLRMEATSSNRRTGDGCTSKQLKQCKLCNEKVPLKQMRVHVGKHIIRADSDALNHSVTTCGFCGENTCSATLEVTSKSKNICHYKPKSSCEFMCPWGRTPVLSKSNPCTNTIVKCKLCVSHFWTYNGSLHYADKHDTHEVPEFVSATELDRMKK